MIKIDKISSAAKNIPLKNIVQISTKIPAVEGTVLAVEILESKDIYNQLESPNGKISKLKKGQKIAVVLGNRSALKGFVGKVPNSIKLNQEIDILNLGGVAGQCIDFNEKDVGQPLKAKVLGAIVVNNKIANISDYNFFDSEKKLHNTSKLIIISGTCMDVGKTTISKIIISELSKEYNVLAAKLSGVACIKDTEGMKKAGAKEVLSFIDGGIPSTTNSKFLIKDIAKGAINFLSKNDPDFIVIEFGDGIYGEYGVKECLSDKEITENTYLHIGCAHDPVGAVKFHEICNAIKNPLDLISGPVTDNIVGREFVSKTLSTRSLNAISQEEKIREFIKKYTKSKK